MAFRIGVPKSFAISRREARIPMEVGVHLSGNDRLPGLESTFTENVSSHGARVLSVRPWRTNDHLTIATLTGAFRVQARVAYCELRRGEGFAIGLEFDHPDGNWVIGSPAGQPAARVR